MYLVDTVVLSELRKGIRRCNPRVAAWVDAVSPLDVYVSVISIGEIERGIQFQLKNNPAFADELSKWLERVLRIYGERILPMTVAVARRWGQLSVKTGNKGLDLGIAATALEHGLTIVTRNVSDFTPTGVAVFNPFDQTP